MTLRIYGRAFLLTAFLMSVLFLIGHPAGAFAVSGEVTDTPGLTISEVGVSVVTGMVLPVVYGFLVRPSNPPFVKVVGGIIVAASASLVLNAVQADGTAVVSWQQVVDVALVYVPQLAAYLGVWKPLDVNERTGPGVAIGRGPVVDVSSRQDVPPPGP